MPPSKSAGSRYRIIDRLLRSKHKKFHSKKDINDACFDAGIDVSLSQTEKDIAHMKQAPPEGFGAPILWDKGAKGYHYTIEFSMTEIPLSSEDFEELKWAVSTLNQMSHLKMFKESQFAIEKLYNAVELDALFDKGMEEIVIQFEEKPEITGFEFIKPLAEAISDKKVVTFDYQKFGDKEAVEKRIHPYLIKEHNDRWYLIGMADHNHEWVPTYGLDRMSNLQLTDQKVIPSPNFNPKKYYKHAFGIINPGNTKPEEVVLSFTPNQGMYARTKKLHSTQKVLIDNDQEYRIQLNVYITIELIMEIQSYGPEVMVIEPAELADLIRQRLKDAAKQY